MVRVFIDPKTGKFKHTKKAELPGYKFVCYRPRHFKFFYKAIFCPVCKEWHTVTYSYSSLRIKKYMEFLEKYGCAKTKDAFELIELVGPNTLQYYEQTERLLQENLDVKSLSKIIAPFPKRLRRKLFDIALERKNIEEVLIHSTILL
ncbi:MAG: hypothetical protein QXR63_00030 [Candidatus Bathyarchaeia archaeon]